MTTTTAKYRELDKDTFVQRNIAAQNRPTGGGAFDYWKPKPAPTGQLNRYKFRIMPPHAAMEDVFVEVKIHFGLGPDPDPKKRVAVNCLTPYGEECPACSHVDRLYALAKQTDDPAEADSLKQQAGDQRAKLRIFANIVDMDHPDKGVQRYAFGTDVEKALRSCFFDDEGDFRNISHPETGRNVIMHVTTKAKTTFPEYPVIKPAEQPSKLADMDWLDGITNLNEIAVKPSREDVENALKGVRPAATTRPATSAPASAGKTAPKPAAAPAAAAPAAPAQAAPAAAPKEATPPVKSKRQAVADEPSDPWLTAREAISKAGIAIKFTPSQEMTPEQAASTKKPPCYENETDPKDDMCKGCRVLLPCYTAFLAKQEAA